MVEIVAAAEVEEMLTPEQCEKFAFTRPTLTAEEAKHAEDLYLSDEFGRDKEKVNAFLTACGVVMTKCFPKPERAEVEELLRELNTEPERVMAFLSALQNMSDLAPKQVDRLHPRLHPRPHPSPSPAPSPAPSPSPSPSPSPLTRTLTLALALTLTPSSAPFTITRTTITLHPQPHHHPSPFTLAGRGDARGLREAPEGLRPQ